MKRLLSILLLIICITVPALAEDLSSMSYDDLIRLRNQLTAEIMSRPEWKQVTVPTGSWTVGEDIPAGYYSVTATDTPVIISAAAPGERNDFYIGLGEGETAGKIQLVEGHVFRTLAPVIFAPPVSLGF